MKSNWNYPTTIWSGERRIDDLFIACNQLELKNPLFVTDKDLISLPLVKKIVSNLKAEIKDLKIFSNFSGNPIGENVTEGVKFYNLSKCDGVIAFGGGSGIDVGKAIAFMCGQTRAIWDFEDIGDWWTRADVSKISPIIAVPTTAGTGSRNRKGFCNYK